MAELSKITLPSGTTYDIKDTTARTEIDTLKNTVTGAMHYIGVTTTALSNGASTNPIKINNADVTAKSGDVAIYNSLEFVFSDSDSKWHEFGSTGSLKALAFKDTASGDFTPAGSVSQPTFTGSATTSTGKFTPAGSNTGGAVTLNTTTINSITDVGTLPSFSATVADENLTLGFSQGTLPTKGANTTVATSVKSFTQPTFTGTEGNVSVSGTPSGSVSKPTFTGSKGTVTVS